MSQQINLKEIERKALKAYYQDGLMEIMMGAYLIFVGGLLFTESKLAPFTVFIIFGLNPVWERLKERFTYPRIGYVTFPDDDEAGKGILKTMVVFFLVGAALAVGLSFLLGSERGWELFLMRIVPAMVGVLLACGPVYAAGTFGLKRMYLIAALFLISGFVAPLAGVPTVYKTIGLQMSLVGVAALLMGIWLMVTFIRTHPLLEEESANAAG